MTISGNDFRASTAGTADNGTDVTITAAVTSFTIGSRNHFAGDGYYINNLNAQNIDLSATTGTTFSVGNNFRIEDRMYDKVDNAASGLITWAPETVFVTAPGTHSTCTADTDSSIQSALTPFPWAKPAGLSTLRAASGHPRRLFRGQPDHDHRGVDAPGRLSGHDDHRWRRRDAKRGRDG